MINPYFLFEIASHRFLIETISLVEVLNRYKIYPVPRAPKKILGMATVRASIVVVFNLRALLNIDSPPSKSLLMIAEHDGQKIGFVVDSVDIAQGFTESQSQSAHPLSNYISKSFSKDGVQAHLLDLESLLSQQST